MTSRRSSRAPFRLRTWKRPAMRSLALPLGVAWFTIFLTLVTTSFSLLILDRRPSAPRAHALAARPPRGSSARWRERCSTRRFPLARTWPPTRTALVAARSSSRCSTSRPGVRSSTWCSSPSRSGSRCSSRPSCSGRSRFLSCRRRSGGSSSHRRTGATSSGTEPLDEAWEWLVVVGGGVVLVFVTPWIIRALTAFDVLLMRALLGPTRGELERAAAKSAEQRDLAVASAAGDGARSSATSTTAPRPAWSRSRSTWAARDDAWRKEALPTKQPTSSAAPTRRRSWRSPRSATSRAASTRQYSPTAASTQRSPPSSARSPVPVSLRSEIGDERASRRRRVGRLLRRRGGADQRSPPQPRRPGGRLGRARRRRPAHRGAGRRRRRRRLGRRLGPGRPARPRRRARRHARRRQPRGRADRDHGGAPVRVVIVEDSGLLRDALTRLLADFEIEVAAAVATAEELRRAAEEHAPDVFVVDVRLPPTFTDEGVRAAVDLRSPRPGGECSPPLAGRGGALRARPPRPAQRGLRLPAQGPRRRRG